MPDSPALKNLTSWCEAAYTGSGTWGGTPSAGTSGSHFVTSPTGVPPTIGPNVNGFDSARYNGTTNEQFAEDGVASAYIGNTTSGSFSFWCLVAPQTFDVDGPPPSTAPLLVDQGGLDAWCITLSTSGLQMRVTDNSSVAHDTPYSPVTLSTWTLCMARWSAAAGVAQVRAADATGIRPWKSVACTSFKAGVLAEQISCGLAGFGGTQLVADILSRAISPGFFGEVDWQEIAIYLQNRYALSVGFQNAIPISRPKPPPFGFLPFNPSTNVIRDRRRAYEVTQPVFTRRGIARASEVIPFDAGPLTSGPVRHFVTSVRTMAFAVRQPVFVALGSASTDMRMSGARVGRESVQSVGPFRHYTAQRAYLVIVNVPDLNLAPPGIPSEETFGDDSLLLALFPAGIDSSEVAGYVDLSASIAGSGIPTEELLGSGSLSGTVSPAGISTEEGIGSVLSTSAGTSAGVPSDELLGDGSAELLASPPGIPTDEIDGTGSVTQTSGGSGILSGSPSDELVGQLAATVRATAPGVPTGELDGTVSSSRTAAPAGIPTGELLGKGSVAKVVAPAGVPTSEVAGVVSGSRSVATAGIPTGEILGKGSTSRTGTSSGIPTGELLGKGSAGPLLAPPGSPSEERVGRVTATTTLATAGLATAEVLGKGSSSRTGSVAGVPSPEIVGVVALSSRVAPPGIPTAEVDSPARASLLASLFGIATAEVVGTGRVSPVYLLSGIATDEVVGKVSLSRSGTLAGAPTEEAIGRVAGSRAFSVAGVPSSESLGTGTALKVYIAYGIPTDEVVGKISLSRSSTLAGIATDEGVGRGTTSRVFSLPGVSTDEVLGEKTVYKVGSLAGIPTAEAFAGVELSASATVPGIPTAEVVGATSVFEIRGGTLAGVPTDEVVGRLPNVKIVVDGRPGRFVLVQVRLRATSEQVRGRAVVAQVVSSSLVVQAFVTATLTGWAPAATLGQVVMTMKTEPECLRIYRGDTLEFNGQVLQPDGCSPFNLTGAKVWSTLKRQLTDLDVQAVSRVDSEGLSVPPGGEITITNPGDGRINVRHAASATLAFEASCAQLYYDVQVRDPLGRVFTVRRGIVAIEPDVTQSEA